MSIVTSFTDPRCVRRNATASASCTRRRYWLRQSLGPFSMSVVVSVTAQPSFFSSRLGVVAFRAW